MALHSGIDTIGFVSNGTYTESYGLGEQANLNNLFALQGLIEDAPTGEPVTPGRGKRIKMELGYSH